MAVELLKSLKELFNAFLDKGEILEFPKPRTIKTVYLDERRLNFLRNFVDLIISTNFCCKETRLYLANYYITKAGVHKQLQQEGSKNKLNTTIAKIFYDSKKITSEFGNTMLVEILHYSNIDIDRYELILADVLNRYSNKKLLQENVRLNLPKVKLSNSLEESEFDEFLQIIAPYIKSQMKFISKEISKQQVGYAQYLLSSTILDEKQQEHKNILCMYLGIEYSPSVETN